MCVRAGVCVHVCAYLNVHYRYEYPVFVWIVSPLGPFFGCVISYNVHKALHEYKIKKFWV